MADRCSSRLDIKTFATIGVHLALIVVVIVGNIWHNDVRTNYGTWSVAYGLSDSLFLNWPFAQAVHTGWLVVVPAACV